MSKFLSCALLPDVLTQPGPDFKKRLEDELIMMNAPKLLTSEELARAAIYLKNPKPLALPTYAPTSNKANGTS